MMGLIGIAFIAAFIYTIYCVFKRGKPFSYRLKMLAIAFIGLPLAFALTGLVADYNDPERYARELEAALVKAESATTDANIIKVLEDFKEDEEAKSLYTAALRREVQKLPASDIEGNLDAYQELAELLPDDQTIQEKVAFYTSKLEEQKQAKEREREKQRAENDAIRGANRARKELESNQVAYCKLAIENSAKFPTKVDFDMGYEYFKKGEKSNVVTGRVELMNGLGVMIPHKYACEFEGLTLINAGATPG